ncbi:hypothetical protein HHI36_012009 [Cryptolaemus montrouzieri]|uniref:Elongation of very long chain fatty acids protein n=1 Tax=Cryptolaemus montrouzieri TaxID=559131 RepID=A0ABD2ND89_9CUCU
MSFGSAKMFPACVNNFVERYADSRSKNFFLAATVWEPLGLIVVYLLFVKKIGPALMEKRKPYDAKKWIIVFDIIQIVSNFYLALKIILVISDSESPISCLELDFTNSYQGTVQVHLAYFYYLLKVSDLMDTVFFIVKKNFRQVSYLHVFHHSLMVFMGWMGLKLAPGGHSAYFGLANGVVHTVMYSYYLICAYDTNFKNTLGVKKFVTQLQLVQFLFIFVIYAMALRPSCGFSKIVSVLAIMESSYFMYLFGNFYIDSYIRPKKGVKQQ